MTKTKRAKYVRVVLNLPLNRSFSYRVPPELSSRVKIGGRVAVPFKKKILSGFVVEEIKKKEVRLPLKEVIKVIDNSLLGDNFLKLGKWISSYYCCSLGQALHSIFPMEKTFKIQKEQKRKRESPNDKGFKKFKPFPPEGKSLLGFGEDKSERSLPSLKEKGIFLFRAKNREERIFFYLSLMKETFREEKQIILIVPEISYIPLLQKLISSYYGGEIAIIHSQLSPRRRYKEWSKAERGEAPLTIGTRSAVFAPYNNLGLIIIEEEENSAYKQKETPRYHLREVAIKRAEIENFPVVLSTGSPSLESWYQVESRVYIPITFFHSQKSLPQVEIVDMRKEKDRIFSSRLEKEVRKNLQENNSILLFLNRRGFANFLLCLECGRVPRCPNCNIGLNLHLKGELICHYCGYREKAPRICPSCKGTYFRRVGWGTEQLEIEVRRKFSSSFVRRGDLDTISSSLLYKKLQDELQGKKVDILIGTQLVIKEEILKSISLVGIVLADGLLNLPDFRAGEYLFQLLVKIRGLMRQEGRLIIQSYNPNHYAIEAVAKKENDFYRKESEVRKELEYPPYLHWVRVLLEGRIKKRVEEAAERIRERVEKEGIDFLGPSSCPFGRIKGKYRYHLVLKGKDLSLIRQIAREKLNPLFGRIQGVRGIIDVDPLQTM